ncbi:SIT4 phosphatase-associated protein-domain-containing protein [Cyathus striatus]|nr:SIT4 phosphatase-associated protein-domain-containing protein [Cyathus striatus]
MDYFERVDVLQKLFGYVTGQIESEEKGRFKYPYVATEVLCSEIWSIIETCIHEQRQLLVPFWETVLDRSSEDMKTEMIMASHFVKITSSFLNKKPAEMLAFIQSQPSIVERLLRHIETPAFPELFSRIIELDDRPEVSGVLEWLSSQNFIGRLIDLLSPEHTPDIHNVVAELLKSIISMANPSPGAGLTEGLQNGPSSNRFARELANRENVSKLISYMLYDFGSISSEVHTPRKEDRDHHRSLSSSEILPSNESAASSVVNSISVVVELIRKHNSDYFEPYLFHTLRNRLIQIQQQLHGSAEEGRDTLEHAMQEMVERMGVVHLGPLLEVMCARLDEFQKHLKKPRSLNGTISTTVGSIVPLTFERYRICELFAELLHCSNMSLLNRPSAFSRLYDSEGRLQGGLSALEDLANVITLNTGGDRETESMSLSQDEIEPALELPISSIHGSPTFNSDDDMSSEPGSSDDEAMEEIAMYDEPSSSFDLSPPTTPESLPRSTSEASTSPSVSFTPASERSAGTQPARTPEDMATIAPRSPTVSHTSRRSLKRERANTADSASEGLPIGEQLKRRLLDLNLLSTVLDLFFDFPWNNFLHSAVYDGLNRELAISLFRDAKLVQRILDGQKRNDIESSKPKGIRLGYMGHLTLIAEDVVTALERFPSDLREILVQYAPQHEWDQYVSGRYTETKKQDALLLGGGKPAVGGESSAPKWNAVDEEEISSPSVRGEFKRATSVAPRNTADFGPAPMDDRDDDEEGGVPQYRAREQRASEHLGLDDDDEDEEEGWLAQSNFSLRNPPISSRHIRGDRRPLSSNGFDDAFTASDEANRTMAEDPFNSADDDGFGPFADPGPTDTPNPFLFGSSFSDEMEDASFDDNFDFGDFQSADDGDSDLTPTSGSWTLAGGDSGIPNDATSDEFDVDSKHHPSDSATMIK